MKQLELKSINSLIDFFEDYIKIENNDLSNRAKELYNSAPSPSLVREEIVEVFGQLFPIGYPDVKNHIKPISKSEAKELLVKLKEIKNKLSN